MGRASAPGRSGWGLPGEPSGGLYKVGQLARKAVGHGSGYLMPPAGSCSPIFSEGNELLVQFVSDLSVTADGFSAFYKIQPRGAASAGPAQGPGENARLGNPLDHPGPKTGTGPKVKPPPKPRVQPTEKPETPLQAKATATGPGEYRKEQGLGGSTSFLSKAGPA